MSDEIPVERQLRRRICGAARHLRRCIALLTALPLLAGCDVLPAGATMQAHEMHQIWVVFLLTSGCVAIIVWGLIAWCLVRWRDRENNADLPPQFKNNNVLEIIWTAIPLVIVAVLFAYTYVVESHVERMSRTPSVTVDVTGYRWSWRFTYPRLGVIVSAADDMQPPVLVLPLGETVAFNVRSADVDHSFAVPAFLFERDAIPGMDNRFDWTPSQLGVFRGECGEFCGIDHAHMTFAVRVVSHQAFHAWVAAHRSPVSARGILQ